MTVFFHEPHSIAFLYVLIGLSPFLGYIWWSTRDEMGTATNPSLDCLCIVLVCLVRVHCLSALPWYRLG